MDKTTVINLLNNSGLKFLDMDDDFIYFQDPSCIFSAFDTLFHYAWIVIMALTAILLFGWAILYIKNGVKINELFNNAKSLILILCILALVKPIVNVMYGGDLFKKNDLFEQQCETKQVSIYEVQKLLDLRNKNFRESDQAMLYENFEIIDSGIVSQPEEYQGEY